MYIEKLGERHLKDLVPQAAIQQRALRTLKQKKMYESQMAQLTQQTFNMESAALATDNLRNTMATVDAMKVANKEMRKQYGKIDIDKIEVRNVFVKVMHIIDSPWLDRVYTMIWRTYWSRQTRSKNHWGGRMQFQTKLMKQIWKQVCSDDLLGLRS